MRVTEVKGGDLRRSYYQEKEETEAHKIPVNAYLESEGFEAGLSSNFTFQFYSIYAGNFQFQYAREIGLDLFI